MPLRHRTAGRRLNAATRTATVTGNGMKISSPYQFLFTDSVMVGAKYAPMWTGGTSEATCGSCHGLPPVGHTPAPLTGCTACHADVVNSSGTIIDKTKHINGKINAFGVELSF